MSFFISAAKINIRIAILRQQETTNTPQLEKEIPSWDFKWLNNHITSHLRDTANCSVHAAFSFSTATYFFHI